MWAFRFVSRSVQSVTFISLAFAFLCSGWTEFAWPAEDVWEYPPFSMAPATLSSAARAVPVPEKKDYIILLDESKYVFAEDGSYTHSAYRIFRILTPSGAKFWTTVESSWRIWREEKPEIQARVITPDGIAHMLDPKTIDEAPVDDEQPDVFSDLRIVRAPLPAIDAGSIVEEEIVVKGKKSLLSNGCVQYEYFGNTVPTHRARFVIDAPAGLPIQYQTMLMDGVKPRRVESGDRVKLIFEGGPLDAFKYAEPFLPPDIPRWPEVAFSTGKSWQDVSSHYSQILEQQIRVAEVQSFVSRANIVGKNRHDSIAALLALVQDEVRYTGVEFGDASWIPRNPAETLQRKYGDCKDKAALLIAMLRAVGIPAHLALLNTSRAHETLPGLPGLGQFNHAIVFVPGSPEIWIDVTSEYSRVGQLPTEDQGRLALIIRPETAGLVKTPESGSKDNLEIETREFFLQELGPARVVETTEAFGSIEERYRSYYADMDPKEAESQFREYSRDNYLAKEQAKGTFSVPQDFSEPFHIRIEIPKADRGETVRTEAVVVILLSRIASRLSYLDDEDEEFPGDSDENADETKKKVTKRAGELLLPEPFVTEWRYKIVPPLGFKARPLPESIRTEMGPALLTREYATGTDGTITAVFRFDTRKRRLSPKEADDLMAGLKELHKEEYILISFDQVGEALIQEGKIRQALDEFRRLSSMHPSEALHHAQIARALLAAGLGEAAREEARRGVQMEPNSAEAFNTLGEVLEHDLIGRRLTRGMDLDGAIAARRKSVELDQDDVYKKINLAILLEHDHQGNRYKSTNGLKEAIEIYQGLGDKLKRTQAENNLHYALLWAGQYETLKKNLKDSEKTQEIAALMLVAIAATEGPAAAIKRASSLESAEEARRTVLRTASETLLLLRMYPQGAELLKASARGAPTAATDLSRAAILARVRRREDVKYGDSEPQSVFYRFIALLLRSDIKEEDLNNLVSRFSRDQSDIKEGMESFEKLSTFLRASLTRAGASIDVVGDVLFSTLEFHIEGNDSIGFEINSQLPGARNFNIFVVKEENRYVMIGASNSFEDVGKLILELVKAGETQKARAWLDRAREILQPVGGDDPLSGYAFSQVWVKGQEAKPEQMRMAAATLISKDDEAGISIPFLMEARNASWAGSMQTAIDLALYDAFVATKKWEDALTVALRLTAASPMSKTAFIALASAQMKAKRWKDCEQSANDRLKALPNDPDAMRVIQSVAEWQADWKKAALISKRIAASGKAVSADFNNQAWHSLFDGSVGEETLQTAQKASLLAQNADSAALHTLATIQAELGNTTEARENLLQSMQIQGLTEPDSNCWYVFARIAEQLGEHEAALNVYKRVTAPEGGEVSPVDIINLAQKRIKILESLGK